MAIQNNVNALVPAGVLSECLQKLAEVKAALSPYLFPITADERRELPKMGDKTLAFVTKAVENCATNPEFVPGFMSVEALKTDFELWRQLFTVQSQLEQLSSDVSDTIMVAGSEAYQQTLLYYASVRAAADKGVGSSKTVFAGLKERFPGRKAGGPPAK